VALDSTHVKAHCCAGGAGSCGDPCGTFASSLPVPGQKLVQLVAPGLPGDDALQHVGQIGLRVECMELRRVDQLGQDRPALGAAFAAAEQ
jgi:hypothetical protein